MSTAKREIKFRVWRDGFVWPHDRRKQEGTWLWDRYISLDGKSYHDDYEIISDHSLEEYGGKIHIEQFTGLKDSKGQDIYEGDIMASRGDYMTDVCDEDGNYPDLHNVVVWSTKYTRFGLLPVDEYNSVLKSGGNPSDQHLWSCSLTAFREVIGNVRQNPELFTS